MIELVIAACLASECREFTLLYDAGDVSLMTCMIAGQPQVAEWSREHPAWQVERWHCDLVNPLAQAEL